MKRGGLLFFFWLVGCASSEEAPKGKYHNATLVNDLFQVEQGMPIREVRPQEFFYKKCELEGRKPYVSKSEYSCSEGF